MQKKKWITKKNTIHLFNLFSINSLLPIYLILFANSAFSMKLTVKDLVESSDFTISDTILEEQEYISIDLIKETFAKTPRLFLQQKKWKILSPKKNLWTFSADNPFVQINNKTYNLTFPVRKTTRGFYLPLQSLLVLLKIHEFNFIKYDYKKRHIIIKKRNYDIENIILKQKNNGTIFSFYINPNTKYKTIWTAPHYIITFDGNLDTNKLNNTKIPPTSLVTGLRGFQHNNTAQISLLIPRKVEPIEFLYDSTSHQVRLVIRSKVEYASPKKTPQQQNFSKTIIIDPGHGGKDPGAISKNHKEKVITLQIAFKLKKILKKKGYKVLLTRSKDTFISLEKRPKFASQNGGDLFISLHCNAIEGSNSRLQKIQGFIVYILRAGKTKEDEALARRENLIFQKKNQKPKKELSDIDWFLLEHELNLYSQQSENIALSIVKKFEKKSSIKKYKTGASQAGFFVLVGTFMPAVLFEMGFITNDKDRYHLIHSKGQNTIANNLASAIDNYFNSRSYKQQ